ncbi:MAG: O-antigen ligase family protein [Burkholderiaceae bacterium]|nr:O-antigen ligase family protein [Burkholderiaceae bacterium]
MNWQHRWQSFAVFSVSFLAVSVSLGVAMVSIAKLLLLIAVVGQLFFDVKHRSFPSFKLWPSMTWWILLAMVWMSLSFLWTESSSADALAGWGRHSRILWFIPVLYLLRSPEQSLFTLKWFVAGMVMMMLSSWALVAGLPVPWATAKELPSLGIVHGSTLEQPVLLTFLAVVLWFMRDHWPQGHWRWVPIGILLLTVFNVFFVMTGRSGFLVMLVFISMAVWWQLPKRWRWLVVGLPFVLAALMMVLSPRFQTRTSQVVKDVISYQQGSVESSQGQRLDYWHRSLLAVQEKPLIGHGVGSWRMNYHRLGGMQADAPSNPHQQYLLWLVEAGVVGCIFFLGLLFAQYKDAQALPTNDRQALTTITAIAALMGLMNCPYFGAGMGECLVYLAASLLLLRR